MPITINLDGVEAWKGGNVLPKGRHTCRCTDAEEGKSSGGHYELHLTWEATAGEFAGGQIQDWVQVTEGSLGRVRQLLEAAKVPVPSGEFSLAPQPFLGKTADVLVVERPKPDGQMRNEVGAYLPLAKGSDLGTNQAAGFASGNSTAKADEPIPF